MEEQPVLLKVAAVAIGAAASLALVYQGIAYLITQLACGVSPEFTSLLSGAILAVTGDAGTVMVDPACEVPVVGIRLTDAAATIALIGLGVWIGLEARHYRLSDRHFAAELKRRPGFAESREISQYMSRRAVMKRASILRPSLRKARAEDVGWRVGRSRGRDVFVSIEDAVIVEGPPRSGKGYRVLISAILDWAGPLITTSTTNDNLTATIERRKERGTVHVFDPQGISGLRNTLRINPVDGCESPLVAAQRGKAVIDGTGLGQSGNNAEWRDVAGQLLGQLMHAAALSGRGAPALAQWGTTPDSARAAVDVLRSNGSAEWAEALDNLLRGDQTLLNNSWFGVRSAVYPLTIPDLAKHLTPRPGDDVFDVEQFLSGENTLYLLGTRAGSGAMGGWLASVLDSTVDRARRRAMASPGSRLDPPLGLILDEIANMFVWNALPATMADGGGRGICTFVVLQALSQAESVWSREEARTIWSAATAKIVLGGANDASHLADLSALLGQRDVTRRQQSWSTRTEGRQHSESTERRPLMEASEISRLPEDLGLMKYRNRRGVLLELQGWTERRDARAVSSGKRTTEQEQREVFGELYAPRSGNADE